MKSRVALDAAGVVAGTDKSSLLGNAHDYLRHYEFFFADYRDQPINLIEIGVMGGNSLKLWKWYFPRAQIIGIDIEPHCRQFREDRVEVLIGSQADEAFMRGVCAQYPPTIVIDDGSHKAEHIITSFETLFPLLAPGGLYVAEDLNCHFGDAGLEWQTENLCDAPGYFMQLALARVAKGGNGVSGGPAAAVEDIDSITFFGGCAILRKAGMASGDEAAREAANDYARTNWIDRSTRMRLALFLVEHGGRVERARRLVAEILARHTAPDVLRVHALVEMAAGDADAARAALRLADASDTPEGYLQRRLDVLRARLGKESQTSF